MIQVLLFVLVGIVFPLTVTRSLSQVVSHLRTNII